MMLNKAAYLTPPRNWRCFYVYRAALKYEIHLTQMIVSIILKWTENSEKSHQKIFPDSKFENEKGITHAYKPIFE